MNNMKFDLYIYYVRVLCNLIKFSTMKTNEVLENLKWRFPNEPEYYQAVEEVLLSIEDT